VFELAPELLPAQRIAYDIAHTEGLVWLRSLGAELRVTHVLELILRLKQICNACPRTGASAKLDDLRRRLQDVAHSGEKALVFSQFVAAPFGAEAIARAIKPLGPLLLTGRMSTAARDDAIALFASDPGQRVLVASLRAGGVGLNLTTASVVFHFDRWWNPAVETQAEDRAHRIGQTRPVQVFAYLTPDSIEQRIGEILSEKRALFADIIDGVATDSLRRLDLPTLLRAVGG
jgi:SNF2 family DNA or RNA helicase